ncbi:transcriptional regulator Kaiso-like [Acipenser ruthenus]|uniref:transcriptional regulator Kaiso-like n=1 Tax=Acipenser ruthenus TaxID=7906 RepID=UPI0027424032|nr:transcriptional regulator Kaiso-like [Acipenser ruthenus]XP_033906353.3 transcriptional regulator Kaiso-like [Acipenser ruthenus]XP_058845361.1 transcriptional regulator Kaiso-like [Acipenser ruthenus]
MASIKLISAADSQYSGTLLKALNEQRSTGLFCDVTIIVQDRKFRAHKNILSSSSTYFHQLFSVAGQVIELNFIKAEIFEEILNYIYSSKIIRVRSDILEELIKSGQTLGVKFIANLGLPLSQVKGLPGLSKDSVPDGVGSSSASKGPGSQNIPAKNDLITQEAGGEAMPIITEAFSLSSEEFKQSEGFVDDDSDSDDVIFCSEITPPKSGVSSSTATQCQSNSTATQGQTNPSEIIDLEEEETAENSPPAPVSSSRLIQGSSEKNSSVVTIPTSEQEEANPAPGTSSSHNQPDSSSLASLLEHESPDTSMNLASPTGSSSWDSFCSPPSTPVPVTSSPTGMYPSTKAKENHEARGVQKKQVIALLENAASKPGEFKIKLSDIGSASRSINGAAEAKDSENITGGKKIITLDKGAEIDALSTGCKVYANIGENTYDIVIPVKDDPGEGDSQSGGGKKSRTAASDELDTSPSRKKIRVKHDDHYELIMDGRIFYICIVCKRSYVCLTSLRRHFNTHSWERKYPCRYCDKVFALAEYRTKHEIHHTGERRYQCLLCEEYFINYQVLSSHCKSVHNQDPSGKKEKDDNESKLYRLLPCKSLQLRPYSYVSNPSGGIPIINEDGLVYHVDPSKAGSGFSPGSQPLATGKQVVHWDDIFVHPGSGQPATYVHPSEGTSEFEFVIPESY